MEHVLLTPGPCMTSKSVRLAAARPDLNHREPEYAELIRETKRRLLQIYPETTSGWIPYLLGGSGTLAVEAMITSCIGQDLRPALVLENGYYSHRIREIFEVHKISYRSLSHGWLEAWDFDRIEAELRHGVSAVFGTHNETTVGRLNDIGRLGAMTSRYGVPCLIDAMSSFGADPVPFPGIDALCSSANKCIHGVPGVSFVLVRRDFAVGAMKKVQPRSYYMNLPMYEGDNPPLTPPIPTMQAFCQALREMPLGGALERGKDYRVKAEYIRESLKNLGLNLAISSAESSCTLTTASIPLGFSWQEWFEANYHAGYVLYGCKGELQDRYFQVSNRGEVTLDQLKNWIEVVKTLLK